MRAISRFRLPFLVAALAVLPGLASGAPARIDVVAVLEGTPGLAVAAFDGGILLAAADGSVHRVYRYSKLAEGPPDHLRVEDVDGDGRAEVIGIGKPTFLLNDNGDPLLDWESGCVGFGVGNLNGRKASNKELVCLHGSHIEVFTSDAQYVWSADLGKWHFVRELGLADLDDSGLDDVEFEVLLKKKRSIWRFNEDGEELGRDLAERTTAVQHVTPEVRQASADLLAGKTAIDFNGDGSAEERVEFNHGMVKLSSGGKGTPIGEFEMPGKEVFAAAVGDLDGDGKPELVLGGLGHVLIVGNDAKIVADLVVDPSRIRREPMAKLNGANASGLEEQEDPDAIKRMLDENFRGVAECYDKRLKAYALTHRGKAILKFEVSAKGAIGKYETLYTDVNHPDLMKCIAKVASKWKVPKAVAPDANVILDMELGWKDSL